MLEIGNGALTQQEEEAHMAIWCLLSSPLLAGNNLTAASPAVIKILTAPGPLRYVNVVLCIRILCAYRKSKTPTTVSETSYDGSFSLIFHMPFSSYRVRSFGRSLLLQHQPGPARAAGPALQPRSRPWRRNLAGLCKANRWRGDRTTAAQPQCHGRRQRHRHEQQTPFCGSFYTRNDQFTKTGSGQT